MSSTWEGWGSAASMEIRQIWQSQSRGSPCTTPAHSGQHRRWFLGCRPCSWRGAAGSRQAECSNRQQAAERGAQARPMPAIPRGRWHAARRPSARSASRSSRRGRRPSDGLHYNCVVLEPEFYRRGPTCAETRSPAQGGQRGGTAQRPRRVPPRSLGGGGAHPRCTRPGAARRCSHLAGGGSIAALGDASGRIPGCGIGRGPCPRGGWPQRCWPGRTPGT